MSDKIHPFSCGSQFADWQASNCERCTKSVNTWDAGGDAWPTCEIESALMSAYCDDGTVRPEIAQRMGYTEHKGRYVWPCGEVDWTEAWKAEWLARKAGPGGRPVEEGA